MCNITEIERNPTILWNLIETWKRVTSVTLQTSNYLIKPIRNQKQGISKHDSRQMIQDQMVERI